MKAAIVDKNGLVVNIVIASANFTVPADYTLVNSTAASIGDTFENGVLRKPPATSVEALRQPSNLEIRLAAIESKLKITEEDKTLAKEEIILKGGI